MEKHTDHNSIHGNIQMFLFSGRTAIRAHEQAELVFKPVNLQEPDAEVPLATQHESDFHLIILHEDLTWFAHVHPVRQSDGTYLVTHRFPSGGNYILFADYQPAGHAPVTDKIPLAVEGDVVRSTPEQTERLAASVDGLDIRIAAHVPFRAGAESHLPFEITRGGEALQSTDIAPYLGAVAHIILVGAADKDFLHIHPEPGALYPVIGHTVFPKAGAYRMWVQFKTRDVLHTADFTLEVREGDVHAGHAVSGHQHHH